MAHLGTDPLAPLAQAMSGLMQYAAFANSPETAADSAEERARRSHGLFAGQSADPADVVASVEQRLGHPLPPAVRASYLQVGALAEALADPRSPASPASQAAQAADPPPAPPEQPTGPASPTPEAPAQAAVPAALGETSRPAAGYISAAQAVHLGAPLLFRTVAETYARRHGWISGLSMIRRWRWYATALLEIALAALAFAAAGQTLSNVPGGLALGISTGGVITFLAASLLSGVTKQGALMRAQLAAYRRTLQKELGQAPSLGEAAAGAGLGWLETPGQTVVWAIALGLRTDLEALLERSTSATTGEPASPLSGISWSRDADAGPASLVPSAPAMFAGIEAIGSQPKSLTASAS